MGRHCERHGVLGHMEPAALFAALSTAIVMYRDVDMTVWLPQTEATLAQVEGR
jgi:hypothetical protein